MKYEFDLNDLTSEKSLWDVFLLTKRIPTSKFNNSVLILTMLALTLNAFFLEESLSKLLIDVRYWAASGFNLSVAILGFLITGFTIFATISKPEMLLAMMGVVHKTSQLPYLKYNFIVFMKVFIYYLSALGTFISVILFGGEGGIISKILYFTPQTQLAIPFIIKIGYITIGTSIVFLVLLLKTFIFNIYAIIMNHLRWEAYSKNTSQDQ